jgi:Tfp pilus assembly protein PilO
VKRNQLLIIGAALLAIVLLWYFLLYAPLGDDLSSAQTQTETEQKKTDGLQQQLSQLQSQAKNGTQQQALLRKLDAAVPEQPDLAEFIIQANEIATESGISFLSISPTPPASGTAGVSVINLTISIGGSFFQLQDYLRLLEKLERLVIVDGITISASTATSGTGTGGTSTADSTSSSSGDTTLSVTLTARMFTRAAPTSSTGGTSGGTTAPGATTTTTVPGTATSSTTAPAAGSTTGGT